MSNHPETGLTFPLPGDGKVVAAGVFEHMEIWNPDRFAENLSATINKFDDIQRSVDQGNRS
jgi:DNA-binding transcriptional regulator/RsmH inhibitor MraZ